MTTTQQLLDVLDAIESGTLVGETHWFDADFRPATGYVVGNGKRGLIFARHAWSDDKLSTAKHLKSVVNGWQKYRALIDCEGFGFWIDGDILYVDPVTHVTDRSQAVLMGMSHNELAIWDLSSQSCINMSSFVLTEVEV